MKYFQWHGDITGVEFQEEHFNDRWWMNECELVVNWDENLKGIYSPRKVGLSFKEPCFNYGLALNGWPVFSAKMRLFLEEHVPGVVQFLPFRLQSKKAKRHWNGYCVGQILRFVDCLDRTRTQVQDNWKPINEVGDVGIRWPVFLDQSLLGNEHLFRIKGYSLCIALSEQLKTAIELAGFKGQEFDLLSV